MLSFFVLTIVFTLYVLRQVRNGVISAEYSVVWLIVGLLGVLFSVRPKTIDVLARILDIKYPPDLFFGVAVWFILVVIVQLTTKISILEKKLRVLNQYIGLTNINYPTKTEGYEQLHGENQY